MSNHLTMFKFILTIIFCGIVYDTSVKCWDIGLVMDQELNFFSSNQTLIEKKKLKDIEALRGLAYDSTSHTMYLSNFNNIIDLFSNHSNNNENRTWRSIFTTTDESEISSLAFDSSINTLFWTDKHQHTISKMQILPDGKTEGSIILRNENTRPHGISLDTCKKRIYWTTTNSHPGSSIQVSNYDGTERKILFDQNLTHPWGLTIDYKEQKLYWSDEEHGTMAKIERSNLDGSERTLIFVISKDSSPRYLAVDRDFIYWSDWADKSLLAISKNNPSQSEISTIFNTKLRNQPSQIITRYSVDAIDCTLNNKIIVEESITVSTENFDMPNDQPGIQTQLCDNYCFKGECKIDEWGKPHCECPVPYTGLRCEHDMCDNYCLNGGRCVIRYNKPSCICNNTRGSRCESTLTTYHICLLYCSGNNPVQNISSDTINDCRCNRSKEEIIDIHNCLNYDLKLIIMSVLIVVLFIIICVLGVYLNKSRRRPRIKKRFIVSKGVTPLTSRPQIQENQCEITIENCCNMNICETPCFEPKLRNPRNNNKIDGDKNSLLDNMEENSS